MSQKDNFGQGEMLRILVITLVLVFYWYFTGSVIFSWWIDALYMIDHFFSELELVKYKYVVGYLVEQLI